MIRFHVVHDKVIYWFVAQYWFHFAEEDIGIANIYGVYERGFLVVDDVRIIGNSFWQRPQIFEQMFDSVVQTNIK